MGRQRMTTALAIVRYLQQQHVSRDGVEQPFFAGCFGIFGHGNVAGIGQALHETPSFPYYQARNEQAMVHTAAAYAKMKNRMQTFACTTSIGPGATNMLTAAAGATINRLPVLLLPGDLFASRRVAPVLQQLESPMTQEISVNDAFRPLSRYWDRINRPEQILTALPEAMRVLTSPAATGAVTLSLPQDVQAEALEVPDRFLEPRTWTVPRPRADTSLLQQAAAWIRASRAPLIVAGGGVLYSEATGALEAFAARCGIPVGETMAGKGALPYDHPCSLGGIGVTGTMGARLMAREADLVIGIGTRYSDFTTASNTAFHTPEVRFININVAEFDAHKQQALPLVADARVTIEALDERLADYRAPESWSARARFFNADWDRRVEEIYQAGHGPLASQGEIIGAVNAAAGARGVLVAAAGSLPGDLHKLWRSRDPKQYHLEYGYSCMGYEIAGGLGVAMADPTRPVYVMVGDGSYLMMAQEIVTAVQERIAMTIILIDNHGFASIGALSQSVGSHGFGTHYRYRDADSGRLDGPNLPIDYGANARSLGARVIEAETIDALRAALAEPPWAGPTVIVIEADRETRVPGNGSWWDVPVSEVSEHPDVQEAYEEYRAARDGDPIY